jgi:predicted nucleic acid-binding protein
METEAKLFIQNEIRNKNIELVWSYIMDFENENNPNRENRELIEDWLNFSVLDIAENDNVIDKSINLINNGLDFYDSLHIACAIEGKADYFVTTDAKILNKKNLIGEIVAINPIDFIKVYTGE